MQSQRSYRALKLFLVCVLAGATLSAAPPLNVVTRNYNNQRTGLNPSETTLNVSTVNPSQFGRLFMLPVDDQIFAGVLYVSNLRIAGGIHNVIFAATVNNSLYAYDADKLGRPLWEKNFNGSGRPGRNTDVGQNCGAYHDFRGNIGIVGTPVIDRVAKIIYFVTRTVESNTTIQRLHAVDITTGAEKSGSPVAIAASVPGTGDGGSNIVFDPVHHNQRPGLSLSSGTVYVGWASFCDTAPYHGWVIAFDATTLAVKGGYVDTPNGSLAGIWMGGAAPAFDTSGNIYLSTGNGTWDGITGFGESLVKLAPDTVINLDYFTPSNYNSLNAADLDFGSGGPSLAPGTNLLITGGKEGKVYLLDLGNLGHEAAGDTQIPQWFQAVDTTVRPGNTHHIHNASPWWNSPQGLNLYVWGENDYLHGFRFDPGTQKLVTTPFATGSILPPVGMPGGMLIISANGSQTGSGIVWATVPRNGDANQNSVPGNLYAFNAETLELLYSSTGTNDDLLDFSKGSAPIVANGKVYAGTLSKFVQVYGPKSQAAQLQNLAFEKAATGTAPCAADETPDKAVNGSFSGGLGDKFCSSDPNPQLTVDLGAIHQVSRFTVEHAAAGGESLDYDTKNYTIETSTDGTNYTTAATISNNTDGITTTDIQARQARYVRLNITKPAQNGDKSARIYEFQIFGSQTGQ